MEKDDVPEAEPPKDEPQPPKDEPTPSKDEPPKEKATDGDKPVNAAPPASGSPEAAPGASEPTQGRAVTIGAVLLVLIVGGVLASFAVSKGGDEPDKAKPAKKAAPPPPAAWIIGQQVDVELTLLPDDRENLACASKQEIAGRHCAFETSTTPWSKESGGEAAAAGVDAGSPGRDAGAAAASAADAGAGASASGAAPTEETRILQPYATTGSQRFLGAGLWSQPALAKLPSKRFSVKCKLTVEGKMPPGVRWAKAGPWRELKNDWFTGVLTNCTVSGS